MLAVPKSLFAGLSFVRGDANRNDRIGAMHRAWGHVFNNHLPGDYYEFGVYRGASLVESYRQYRKFRTWLDGELSGEEWRRSVAETYLAQLPPKFIGCDTFAGIPANDEGSRILAEGHFACSEEEVRRACAAAGFEPVLVKGLFAETRSIVRRSGRKAAIVNIDGDLYQSGVDALETVTPLVQQGTVLLCDNYRAFNNARNKGERRALNEWEAASGIEAEPWFAYHMAGHAFILNT